MKASSLPAIVALEGDQRNEQRANHDGQPKKIKTPTRKQD